MIIRKSASGSPNRRRGLEDLREGMNVAQAGPKRLKPLALGARHQYLKESTATFNEFKHSETRAKSCSNKVMKNEV